MKTRQLKLLMLATLLSLGFIACETSTDGLIEEQQIIDTPYEGAIFPTEMEHEQKLLAKVQKNGHELEFYTIGGKENPGILTLEQVYGKAKANNEPHYTIVNSDRSPFDHFIRLTDANVLVPLAIAETAKEDALEASGRSTTKLIKPLMLLDKNFNEDAQQNIACADLGFNGFRNTYCGGGTVISLPTDIKFCDAGTWTSHTRNSYFGSWREGRTAISGTNAICGTTRVEFYGWYNSKWNLEARVDIPNGAQTATSTRNGSVEQSVRRTRLGGNQSFRAYTRFKQ